MKLTIDLREDHGVAVLNLGGRLILGEECSALRDQVNQLLAAEKKKILLNLRELTYVDSSGIATLVESVINTAKQDGELKLTNLDKKVRGVLTVHRLINAFEVFDSEEAAFDSFRG